MKKKIIALLSLLTISNSTFASSSIDGIYKLSKAYCDVDKKDLSSRFRADGRYIFSQGQLYGSNADTAPIKLGTYKDSETELGSIELNFNGKISLLFSQYVTGENNKSSPGLINQNSEDSDCTSGGSTIVYIKL